MLFLAISLFSWSQARADLLGLAPGTYEVTLLESENFGFCSPNDCIGRVTIPAGAVTTLNYNWEFLIPGHDFLWDDPILSVDISPDGLSSCALESVTTGFAWLHLKVGRAKPLCS